MFTEQLSPQDLDYLGWLEEQWVVDQFDAIIAAGWPRPTLDNGSGDAEADIRSRPERGSSRGPQPGLGPRPSVTLRVPGRQRSPPKGRG